MFPEKRESFAPKNFGNMPSEPPSLILERSKFFLVRATSKFHPAFPVIFAKQTEAARLRLSSQIIC